MLDIPKITHSSESPLNIKQRRKTAGTSSCQKLRKKIVIPDHKALMVETHSTRIQDYNNAGSCSGDMRCYFELRKVDKRGKLNVKSVVNS